MINNVRIMLLVIFTLGGGTIKKSVSRRGKCDSPGGALQDATIVFTPAPTTWKFTCSFTECTKGKEITARLLSVLAFKFNIYS